MTRLDSTRVRREWAVTLDRVIHKGERIAISRHGRTAAAIVSAEDLELLERLEDRIDLEEARASLRDAEKRGTKSWERVKKAAGL